MLANKQRKIAFKLSTALKTEASNLSRLNSDQLHYINFYIKSCAFLDACPGSGKTEVIGIKAAYEISQWKDKKGGIAVVTFTNSAAKELIERIKKYTELDTGVYPHFVGTFDSWLHNYLFQPYCHYLTKYEGVNGDKSIRIIEEDTDAGFLSRYKIDLKKNGSFINIKPTDYFITTEKSIDTHSDRLRNIIPDGLTHEEFLLLRKKKAEFFKAGFLRTSKLTLIRNLNFL